MRVKCINAEAPFNKHIIKNKIYDAYPHENPLGIYIINDKGIKEGCLIERFKIIPEIKKIKVI